MGWTGSTSETAQQIITSELQGVEVLGRSGNWVIWKKEEGHVGLTYFITKNYGRTGGGVAVKAVSIGEGPYQTPPASIAKKYLGYYGNDYEKAGGKYGAPILAKAMEPKVKVEVGEKMYLKYPANYQMPDGSSPSGWYIYLGKYRAKTEAGKTIGLTKNWKSMVCVGEVEA